MQISDSPQLREVFTTSVHQNAAGHYTKAQLDAWAPAEYDAEEWERLLVQLQPFIVEQDGLIVGFADLQPNGYIDRFYVRGGWSGRGIGTAMLDYILDLAWDRSIPVLTAHVSLAAQPLFLSHGFEIVEHEEKEVRGQVLARALMRKS
jgi:putative acetyltransferase